MQIEDTMAKSQGISKSRRKAINSGVKFKFLTPQKARLWIHQIVTNISWNRSCIEIQNLINKTNEHIWVIFLVYSLSRWNATKSSGKFPTNMYTMSWWTSFKWKVSTFWKTKNLKKYFFFKSKFFNKTSFCPILG